MSERRSSRKSASLLSRSERKQLGRQALLDAALVLIGQGRSFTNLGIREITREAGVVPNAFYGHFRNTDEIGLALIETSGVTLRQLLREARAVGVSQSDMVRRSVEVYLDYVKKNRVQFRFILSERSGSSRLLRLGIRNDVTHFGNEMAQDLRRIGVLKELSTTSLQMVCGMITSVMLASASDILDLPPDQPLLEEELMQTLIDQVRIALLGAAQWRSKS